MRSRTDIDCDVTWVSSGEHARGRALWSHDTNDPLALKVTFYLPGQHAEPWTFAADMVRQAIKDPGQKYGAGGDLYVLAMGAQFVFVLYPGGPEMTEASFPLARVETYMAAVERQCPVAGDREREALDRMFGDVEAWLRATA